MEKQKKLKFNLVDVIFILVLLAGAAFVALRLGEAAWQKTLGVFSLGHILDQTFETYR